MNGSGTLAYDVYAMVGSLVTVVANATADYGPAPLGLPAGVTGTLDVYLRVHNAPGAGGPGTFTLDLQAS